MGRHTFDITTDNFQAQVLDSELPVLVDFGADWCPPCKMLDPIVDGLAQKYEGTMRIGKIDVDVHPDLQMQFGVMGLPTLILFREGAPVQRIVGFQIEKQIEAQLLPHLNVEQA